MMRQDDKSGIRQNPKARYRRRRRKKLLRIVVMAALVLFLSFCVFAAIHAGKFLYGLACATLSGLKRPSDPPSVTAPFSPQSIRAAGTQPADRTQETNDPASADDPDGDSCLPGSFLDQALDIKLEEILTPGGDARRQIKDIYAWARLNLTYGSVAGKPSLVQAAEDMLLTGCGDCYSFYAVTKLMFDKLGIPNVCVRKLQTVYDSSEHYWSLVSTDEGKTWYHFDATPRAGEGDDFCLVTDAFLDAYSESHKESHRRDKSLYPATP